MEFATFNGFAEFSDASASASALSLFWRLPAPHRLVITDTTVYIEARWRWLRSIVRGRSCKLSDLHMARLRGALVILNPQGDVWWSFYTSLHCRKIMDLLASRGVATTIDK